MKAGQGTGVTTWPGQGLNQGHKQASAEGPDPLHVNVGEQGVGGGQASPNLNHNPVEEVPEGLAHFEEWIEDCRREGKVFTVVVDACNVAYNGQNGPGGRFQVSQVQRVVSKLEGAGEKVLLVFPERYLQPIVPNSTRFGWQQNGQSVLLEEELQALEDWEKRGILYRCKDGADDDFYWMLFTILSPEGRACVVTNDEMRDHRMALLQPVPFQRWKNTQVRRFRILWDSACTSRQGTRTPLEVVVQDPPHFTRDMQGTSPRGGVSTWHIPLGDTGDQWLCLDLESGMQQWGKAKGLKKSRGRTFTPKTSRRKDNPGLGFGKVGSMRDCCT
ncbi:unnamed protein product [Discosporangium mesarthrocarpum]